MQVIFEEKLESLNNLLSSVLNSQNEDQGELIRVTLADSRIGDHFRRPGAGHPGALVEPGGQENPKQFVTRRLPQQNPHETVERVEVDIAGVDQFLELVFHAKGARVGATKGGRRRSSSS